MPTSTISAKKTTKPQVAVGGDAGAESKKPAVKRGKAAPSGIAKGTLTSGQADKEWQQVKEKVKRQTKRSTTVAMNRLASAAPSGSNFSAVSLSKDQMTAMLKKAGLLTESGNLPIRYR